MTFFVSCLTVLYIQWTPMLFFSVTVHKIWKCLSWCVQRRTHFYRLLTSDLACLHYLEESISTFRGFWWLFHIYRILHRKIEYNIGLRCRQRKSQPEGKRIMPETRFTSCKPHFRHYPLTRRLGFLGLHQRTMFDYFSYLWHSIIKYHSSFLLFMTFYIPWRPSTNVVRCPSL